MIVTKRKLLSSSIFYFWYGSIDKSNFVIGLMVGVWLGGNLGKRNHELH